MIRAWAVLLGRAQTCPQPGQVASRNSSAIRTWQLQLTGPTGTSRHRLGGASGSHIAWRKCPFLPCAVLSFNKHIAKAVRDGPYYEGDHHLSLAGLLTTKSHLLLLYSLCALFMWPTKCSEKCFRQKVSFRELTGMPAHILLDPPSSLKIFQAHLADFSSLSLEVPYLS